LYLNKKNLSRFTSYRNIKENDKELFSTSSWSYSYADFVFSEPVQNEIWCSAKMYMSNTLLARIGIGVLFSGGGSGILSYDGDTFYIPYASNATTTSASLSNGSVSNSLLCPNSYNKVIIHAWVDPDDNCKLCMQVFVGEKNIQGKATAVRRCIGKQPIVGFNKFRIGGNSNDSSSVYFKDIIVSDKEITAGMQIEEIPIATINGWAANDDNSFTATEFDTEGTLIPDAIAIAKLKDYNIQNSSLSGKYLRQGDSIKNLNVKAGTVEKNYPLDVDVTKVFSQELGITDVDILSAITISPKG
jgi:hypothetical protein